MYIYSDFIIRIYIYNTEYTHIYDYMHVFLSPLLNSKTSDPPTVQTFYEACIVASLSYPLVKDTVWFWGTISSKIKMPYARNIALDQICVFFTPCPFTGSYPKL